MNSGLLGGLFAVIFVIVIAMLMRSSRSSDEPSAPRSPEPPQFDDAPPEPEAVDGDSEGAGGQLVVAVTSDGHALIPDRHVVRLLPPEETGEEWKVGAGIRSSTLRAERAFGMTWSSGDLRGARIVRGGAEEGAWVLETLGRDGEFIPFDFETREAAEAAQHLFESHGVVQLGEDEDGNRVPPSSEQFEEARRLYAEGVAELEVDDGEEPR
jgi:hypothetical protein